MKFTVVLKEVQNLVTVFEIQEKMAVGSVHERQILDKSKQCHW